MHARRIMLRSLFLITNPVTTLGILPKRDLGTLPKKNNILINEIKCPGLGKERREYIYIKYVIV
jgi:hypothetical protein